MCVTSFSGPEKPSYEALEQRIRELAHELSRNRENFHALMAAMNDLIYVCSPDFTVEFMNPAMIRHTGRDAVGESCYSALQGLEKICPWCVHEKVMKGEFATNEFCSSKDGRTYHGIHSPLFHKNGSISKLTVFRDITEIKKMEASLQQAQKMEAIGTLAGGIAHDFNNILFSILGHAEMLLQDAAQGSREHNSLEQIHTAALRAKDLIAQILLLSRETNRERKQEIKPVHLQQIIKSVLHFLKATAPSTITIREDLDFDGGMVRADVTQIHQVIMNLGINAFHAMEKKGGVLDIRLRQVKSGEIILADPDPDTDTYACITISDTGTGMDSALVKKIFDPFFTTKGKKGTGMGLSVVHGIVKGLCGHIQVNSVPGKGTDFCIYLPCFHHPKLTFT